MKEFKGTKGAWFAARDANGLGIFTEREKICTLFEHRHSGEEVDSNAQLIAAAPDLLEALLSLMDGVANLPPLAAIDGVLKTEWEQGLKAINKALGL